MLGMVNTIVKNYFEVDLNFHPIRVICFRNSDPAASTVMHRILAIDDIPIYVKQYKFPISLKEEVERQVQEILESGIIKPSSSPYNSPLWIVPK